MKWDMRSVQGVTAEVQLPVTAHASGTWQEPAWVTKSIWLTVEGDTVQHCGRQQDQEVASVWIRKQRVNRKWDKTIKPQGSSLVIHSLDFPNISAFCCLPAQHIANGLHSLWTALSLPAHVAPSASFSGGSWLHAAAYNALKTNTLERAVWGLDVGHHSYGTELSPFLWKSCFLSLTICWSLLPKEKFKA